MAERLSKKQLKEDPFFEEVVNVLGFFEKNWKTLLIIGIVVLLFVGGFFIVRSQIRQNEREASGYFGIAMDAYKKQDYFNAEEEFFRLAESYKNTSWGKRAYFYLALIERTKGGSQAQGLDYMETFVAFRLSDPLMKSSAHQYIASVYESQENYLIAADHYFEAAKQAISKNDKMDLGIRAAYAYSREAAATELQAVLDYLESLKLNEGDKNRLSIFR